VEHKIYHIVVKGISILNWCSNISDNLYLTGIGMQRFGLSSNIIIPQTLNCLNLESYSYSYKAITDFTDLYYSKNFQRCIFCSQNFSENDSNLFKKSFNVTLDLYPNYYCSRPTNLNLEACPFGNFMEMTYEIINVNITVSNMTDVNNENFISLKYSIVKPIRNECYVDEDNKTSISFLLDFLSRLGSYLALYGLIRTILKAITDFIWSRISKMQHDA